MAKRLTKSQKDFILKNYITFTDEQLSIKMGVSINTISRIRRAAGINKKKRASKISGITPVETTVVEDIKKELVDYKKDEYWEAILDNNASGRKIAEMLTPIEWEIYRSEWVNFHKQFEDLTHTEENTIEHIIFLRIRIFHNQRSLSRFLMEKDTMGIIHIATLDLSDENEAQKLHKVTAIDSAIADINREYKDLLEKANQLYKSLNATREQRESKGRITSATFFNLVELFKDKKTREKEGRLTELLRVATEKNMDKMREGVEFMDGEIAPQLLDSKTVEIMKRQQEKQNDPDS